LKTPRASRAALAAVLLAVIRAGAEGEDDETESQLTTIYPRFAVAAAGRAKVRLTSWTEPGASTFVLHRVSVVALRKVLFSLEPGVLPRTLGQEMWEGPDIPLAGEEPGPQGERILSFAAQTGLHVLEERFGKSRSLEALPVSRFFILLRALSGKALAYASDPVTKEPREGVRLEIRSKDRTLEARTDARGLASFDLIGKATVIASMGDDLQVVAIDSPKAEKDRLAFISTDRPIYTPGQTVRWKAIVRERLGSIFSLPPRGKLPVVVVDPALEAIDRTEISASDSGTLESSFKLPDDAAPGRWLVLLEPGTGWLPWRRTDADPERFVYPGSGFEVVQPREPELEVRVGILKPPPSRGSKGRARIQVTRPAQGPVARARVSWSAHARSISRLAPGLDPTPFPDPRGWLFEDWDPGGIADRGAKDYLEELASGTGLTGPDGSLEVAFRWTQAEPALEFVVRAMASVAPGQEGQGEGRAATGEKVLRMRLATKRSGCLAGELVEALARVTDLDGRPVAGVEVALEGMAASEVFARTDGEGIARFEGRPKVSGTLLLKARLIEAGERTAEDTAQVWIAGDGEGPDLVTGLDLPICEEGQTIRLLAASMGPPCTALIILESEGRLEARPVWLGRGGTAFPITVPAGSAPNLFVEIVVPSAEPFGSSQKTVQVFPRDRFLDVEIVTSPRSAKPGESVRVEIRTLLSGMPVQAEVGLSVVDESAFRGLPVPPIDIRKFFYAPWTHWRGWSSSVEMEGNHFKRGERFICGTGGDPEVQGLAALGLLPGLPADLPVQNALPETLLWAPRLETGPDGRAVAELRAPAEPCRLRITTQAVSGTDRFGTARTLLTVER
jgi:hypothetical protein